MAHSKLSPVVDGITYLVHPQCLLQIVEPTGFEPIPVVLLPIGDSITSVDDALQLINRFAEVDDVYSPSFSHTAVIRCSSERGFMEVLQKFEASGHFSAVYHVPPSSSQGCLPAGPYFLYEGGIHQAYRLYEDTLDSFIFGVIPDDVLSPKRYTALNLLSSNGLWKSIPVPSRLYDVRTSTTPLAGARMGIKDIFRLEGTQTTMMSRPWIELYDPDEQSADYTKKLINLGAVIVGKTKMTSFASPEEPTDQWIDFHCPVNPRGDGYQSPSSSSTGAATSLAGYEWVDFSIAGDSAGSVRAPAPCNGLFSLRPSFGSTSMNGIPVNSPAFDTVGQFGRSLDDLHFIVSHTFENIHQTFSEFPTKILIPKEFYPLANAEQQAMTEEFVKILEDFLGVKRTPFSFVEEWEKNPPQAAGGLPLLEYTEKSAFWSLCYDYYHRFDSFRDEYSAKFGKKPFVSSVVRFRWDFGKHVTFEEYETYMKQLEVFRNWFTENIMGPDSKTLSNAILIMPYGEPRPEYRDEANPPAGTFPTIAEKFISPILHAPQLVLPFAQMSYLSKISGRSEMRPIASTMIGAKGSDLMLIKLATEAFKKAGWPTSIQTGRYTYPVADNARNVGSVPIDRLLTFEIRQTVWETLGASGDNVDDYGKSNTSVCNVI
ncbi:amidase signature domain-containing protein [Fusarium pseudoanthophilum]|uniref:Amidase signature domain-containing protein n=1 Tax=Fusarium pseudoanthophilum TaxID=48495 RepID=A0A8H5L2L2_9HYPO|nr:amidase signature domain-containing protein [Fusarium pseudoanthophilum]